LLLAAAIVVVATSGGGAWYWMTTNRSSRVDLITHTVRKEPLHLTIVERGQLESAANSDIYCRVRAGNKGTVATTIKWLIDDGSHVTRGQLICELDDSAMQEQMKTQKITLDQARAAWISAEENYKIVDSQNLSDIKTAEVTVKLAELDLKKYVEGEYRQLKRDIEGRQQISESNLVLWQEKSAYSDRMFKRGFVTASVAQGDRFRMKSAEIDLEKVREEMRVLEEYTFLREKTDRESKLAEAKRNLDRVKSQSIAKEKTAESERESKRSIYEQERLKLKDIEDEILKCTIIAPHDGMVVYYMPDQSRDGRGSQQSIVAQGEPVREGQKLMRLPDLTRMQVSTRVHEAMVSRVRAEVYQGTGFGETVRAALMTSVDALERMSAQYAFSELRENFRDKEHRVVYGGQQASIRVDAFPDRLLRGHVKTVATVAAQSDWMSTDVKVYTTIVSIDEPVQNLKPGMSAEVTIFVDSRSEPVIQVPSQAIIGTAAMGQTRKCYVLLPDGTPEEREVLVGRSNNQMAEIREGLKEGEEVIVNPRVLLSDRDKGKLGALRERGAPPAADNAKSVGEGKGGKGGEFGGKGGEFGGKGGGGGKGGKRAGGPKGPGLPE
jgi:multidrug efflux pump subunit AcrA (membrane-fusion protein)